MMKRIAGIFFAVAVASAGLGESIHAQPAASNSLPDDIDPESWSRLPALTRDELDAEGRAAWDLVVGDGERPLTGPAAVSMHSPKVAEAFHLLNQYLRFDGVLEPRDYEVAILQAAWDFEQAYEWSAHEGAARRLGVPEEVIDTIKYDRPHAGIGGRDELIISFARALLRDHEVSSGLYADVVGEFGRRGMVDLATIMGDYIMVGLVLTAADQHLPPNREDTLPER
jgi:4-carboxymuconolactone decarboxylase